MKVILFITAIIPIVTLSVIAGILAFHGLAGWGWFLFAALCCTPSIKWGSDDDKNKEDKE